MGQPAREPIGEAREAATVRELVGSAAKGDRRAWDAIVDRYGTMVWAIARSHRLSASDAADVSQTTWLRLVEHLDRITQPERIGAWLATTAKRESLRVVRLGDRQVTTASDAIVEHNDPHSPALDAGLLSQEREKALWRAFSMLAPRCQMILRLLTAEEPLSYRDLSDALDMPVGSIGPTRARCLEHLRRIAADQGLVLEPEDLS